MARGSFAGGDVAGFADAVFAPAFFALAFVLVTCMGGDFPTSSSLLASDHARFSATTRSPADMAKSWMSPASYCCLSSLDLLAFAIPP